MNKFITITSKGQTTLPAAMRRKLGLGKTGGLLQATYNERKGQLIISKPENASELSERISAYIAPNTQPITNVDAYYQANRNREK